MTGTRTRHGCPRAKGILFHLSLLLACLAGSGTAWAACSATYFGRATINEIRYQNANDSFVELKLLDGAITPAEYQDWTLRICTGFGSSACYSISVGSASTFTTPYIVFKQTDVRARIDLAGGMAIRLDDAAGNTIDYFRIGSYTGLLNGGCTPPYDWQMPGHSKLKNPFRDPDGTGDWAAPPGNSDGDSEGATNPPPDGSGVPSVLLSSADVVTTRGTPATFTLSLSAPSITPVTIGYETAPSTAVAGTDYTHTADSVTIPANATSATVSVPTLSTSAADGQQFYLVLVNVAGARVEDHFHAATIIAPPIPAPLANWRMEEAAGVSPATDSSGNGYTADRSGVASTADDDPVIATDPGTCRYGTFNSFFNSSGVLTAPGLPHLSSEFTFTSWVYYGTSLSSLFSGYQTIVDDYDLAIGPGYALQIEESWFSADRLSARFDSAFVTSSAGLSSGNWYFVAMSIKPIAAGSTRVTLTAIDTAGNVVASGQQTVAASMTANTSSVLFGNSSGGAYPLFGRLDEITYFASELSLRQLQEVRQRTHECGTLPVVHHFELLHDTDALTCAPEPVTVLACADNAVPCTLYPGDVDITVSPSGWVDGDSRIVSAGWADLELRRLSPGTATLALTSTVSAAQPPICRTGGPGGSASTCAITFHDSGFVFDVPEQTACAASAPVTIRAVRMNQTTQTCGPAFSGSKTVQFSFAYDWPGTGTRPLLLSAGGSTVSLPTSGSAVGASLLFDANGESSLAVQYADAGRLKFKASYTETQGGQTLTMGGEDLFVVRPHSFYLNATTDGVTALANTGAAGAPHWAAGENFRLQARGQCTDGTITPNYAPTGAQLWVEPVSPAAADGAVAGTLSLRGSDYAASFAPSWTAIPAAHFSGGALIESSQPAADPSSYALAAYSEVGTLSVHVRDANYFGGTVPASTRAVGRFRPHHFDVSANLPAFRDGTATWACTFTYTGQPFGYASDPVVTVTARNAANAVTSNYGGAFWRLSTGLQNRSYSNTANALAIEHSTDGGPAGLSGNGDYDGAGAFTISGDELRYVKTATPQLPFGAEVSLRIAAADLTDSDGVCFDADANGSCDDFELTTIGGTELRYGRLTLGNGYGSELRAVELPARAEYWQTLASGAGFGVNVADSCSRIADATTQIVLDGYAGSLGAGETSASIDDFTGGLAELTLSAPGAGNDGSVRVRASPDAWLQFDWSAGGALVDPVARATFGIYRGSDRVIFTREMY